MPDELTRTVNVTAAGTEEFTRVLEQIRDAMSALGVSADAAANSMGEAFAGFGLHLSTAVDRGVYTVHQMPPMDAREWACPECGSDMLLSGCSGAPDGCTRGRPEPVGLVAAFAVPKAVKLVSGRRAMSFEGKL